jgi:outer membrane immunogenic protein
LLHGDNRNFLGHQLRSHHQDEGDFVKNRLLASVALPAILAWPAMAADMPVKARSLKARPLPAAVFSWTGFYAGLNVGGAWGRSDATTTPSCALPAPPLDPYFCSPTSGQANAAAIAASGSGSMSGSAFTGGGQIGYNLQNGSVVYGVELDVESFNIRASRQASANYPVSSPPVGPFGTFTIASAVSTDWLFTTRGRVGWAFGNVLAYATGGLATTNLGATNSFIDNVGLSGTGTWSGSATKVGWTVGGGLEWAWSRDWSVKAEYLYLNFGSVAAAGTIFNPQFAGYANAISTSTDLTAQVARLGVNRRF